MSYYIGNDIDLGTIVGSGESVMLGRRDRARHTYLVGSTRTGKSKLLEGMCRQDLLNWSEDHCPMVVMDPDGNLFDNLMGYMAAENLTEWPVIPFDLRRNDLIVSYDLLRKRNGADPGVVCKNFAQAITHAWGQTNNFDTPLLASTLFSILMIAYERECTLVEALQIITDPSLRGLVTPNLESFVARITLENASGRGERGFHEMMQSMMLRINAFLTCQVLRATLCTKTGQTLDMAEVLEKGKILLVCLSTAGDRVAQEDAAALGSVLLTDLWSAARRRGKAEEGVRAPCYLYIDEFQNYLTPDIAFGLAEASGYGIHMTMAHQYPSQLPDRARELGTMILNAVLGTAKNKIVFQVEHPDDLEKLALVMGRQAIDLNKVKQEIWSTKVVRYDLKYLPAYSIGTSEGTTTTEQWGTSKQFGYMATNSWSDTESAQEARAIANGTSDGTTMASGEHDAETRAAGDAAGTTKGHGRSRVDTASESAGRNWNDGQSSGTGRSSGNAKNQEESLRFGSIDEDVQEKLHSGKGGDINPTEIEALKRQRSLDYTLSEGKVENENENSINQSSSSKGGNEAKSASRALGESDNETASAVHTSSLARSKGRDNSLARQRSRNHTETVTQAHLSAHTDGGSETYSEIIGENHLLGEAKSKTASSSISWQPMLLPVFDKELSSREFESVKDQFFRFEQFLDAQPDRHCLVRLSSNRIPQKLSTSTIDPSLTTDQYRQKFTQRWTQKLPFVTTMGAAEYELSGRIVALREKLRKTEANGEPTETRRKIVPPSTQITANDVRKKLPNL